MKNKSAFQKLRLRSLDVKQVEENAQRHEIEPTNHCPQQRMVVVCNGVRVSFTMKLFIRR